MKKLILLAAFLMVAGAIFGQTLQKGNLIGVHVMDLKLQPDVTYNQWKDFYLNTVIPKNEELTQGDLKIYLIEGIRGENKNEIGIIYLFKSEAVRDKYMNDDGSATEFGKPLFEKLNKIFEELGKFEKSSNTTFTDWIVQ
jgi:hypothetical protein